MDAMNMANVAWVMASTALVMVMLPGLSLFYSGLVSGKNALATAMHSFTCLGSRPEEEALGLDAADHGETAYMFGA